MENLKFYPMDKPLVINAILCRLKGDLKLGVGHSIPADELRLILEIVEAAVRCVEEWEPSEFQKSKGCGTGVGMRSAEDQLIRCVRRDVTRRTQNRGNDE